MLGQALLFLFDVLLQPFAAVLLLRFHLQWLRVPLRNPAGDIVLALTNFLVLPVRRFIPSMRGYDSATLLLALIAEMIYLTAVIWLTQMPVHGLILPGLLALALVKLLKISFYLLMGAVLIQAIMSWVNPYSPLAPVLNAVTLKFLQPLRRFIPLVSNIDFTPFVLLILCQLLLIIPVSLLEGLAFSLL